MSDAPSIHAELKETAKAWKRSGQVTDHLCSATRSMIHKAAREGLTPEEIRKAVGHSKDWVEECILREETNPPVPGSYYREKFAQ